MGKCKHKETITLSMVSLWGPFEVFCCKCGVCTSRPDVEPRLEEVKRYVEEDRRMEKDAERFEAKMAAMTPEERCQWQKDLAKAIEERLDSDELKKQLKPFRQPHNRLPRCDCFGYKRLG